jgi:hypothetical protein
VVTAPRGDGLLGGISHSITVRCPVGWPHVPADDIGPLEDFHDGPKLHQPKPRDSLHPIPGGGGDAQVSQQSLKPTGGDRSLSPEGLNVLDIPIQLLTLLVAHGRCRDL